mmetsp:Transcript_49320/g.105750  ORF Transcript_49320/g.105750 Transcript_49320/m.105750 type:complete len:228 (-) Transcript_49320:212-895(-)
MQLRELLRCFAADEPQIPQRLLHHGRLVLLSLFLRGMALLHLVHCCLCSCELEIDFHLTLLGCFQVNQQALVPHRHLFGSYPRLSLNRSRLLHNLLIVSHIFQHPLQLLRLRSQRGLQLCDPELQLGVFLAVIRRRPLGDLTGSLQPLTGNGCLIVFKLEGVELGLKFPQSLRILLPRAPQAIHLPLELSHPEFGPVTIHHNSVRRLPGSLHLLELGTSYLLQLPDL